MLTAAADSFSKACRDACYVVTKLAEPLPACYIKYVDENKLNLPVRSCGFYLIALCT
jgi:hypothetical protein